jgi:N-ethylmaleimide reductase
MQIAHNGRNSHSSLMPDGGFPVAPSAVPPSISALTKDFQQVTAETPRALETSEIAVIVSSFRQAALNAYGGPKENRARFLLEIVAAVTAAIGVDRLGVRLSPLANMAGSTSAIPWSCSASLSGNSVIGESPICT